MVISKIQVSDPGPSWPSCFLFIMVWSKTNLQIFQTSPREITFCKLLKSQCELLHFVSAPESYCDR